jgi:hypothetical protein
MHKLLRSVVREEQSEEIEEEEEVLLPNEFLLQS